MKRILIIMLRSVSMDEISDGKLYSSSDMVRADSLGCDGCHECCCHMGNSILLDPFDVYQMSQGLHVPAAALFNGQLQLTPVDGIVLPAIAMTSDKDQCSFLNKAGRCSIHMFRPGFCRLFPLGRVYDGTGFSYFLQTGQCKKERLAKVIKTLHSYILKVFYLTPYQDGSDFYDQFYMRLNDAKKLFL